MLLKTSEVKRIIIFRALQLGDTLCAIPAIRALRNAYPLAEITICGLPWAKSLPVRFAHYFDKFIHFPGYPGLPEQEYKLEDFTHFLDSVQNYQFDLALQMQGNGTLVNPMIELFGARFTAGFYTVGHYYTPNGLFLEYPNYGSEVERHLLLMKHLGINPLGSDLEFPLTKEDYAEFEELDIPVAPMQYVCIHPGSRGAWRQWPTEYFAALADFCFENGFTPVLTGTKDELPIAVEVIRHMKYKPVLAVGKTSLGSAGVLLKNAYALISNCTGVSHMAAAFKTRSIVISMDGEPERWAPINRKIHKVIDWTKNSDFELVANWLKAMLNEKDLIS